jgi:hypothetical protein
MLPVYSAISFIGIIDRGGKSKPWIVLVDRNGTPVPYVVKLFFKEEIDEGEKAVKEVLGNVMAKEFDLPVPQPALIEMDDYFLNTIWDANALHMLTSKDERIKFGCEYLEGYYQFIPNVSAAYQLREIISIDSVFGFDNLIRNTDRGGVKSNLLIRGDKAVLIDHELAFEITDKTIREEFDTYMWAKKFYEKHIFYFALKASITTTKNLYFGDFEEYLRIFNVNVLSSYLLQMKEFGHPIEKHLSALNYFNKIREKRSNFITLLRLLIR